jgi:hypothetical protein
MADETVPKADFDALQAKHDGLTTKHNELNTTHATTLQTLQGVEAERDAASGRVNGLQESVVGTLMAPLVERLSHHPESVQALIPKPTFDEATGQVSEQWQADVNAWFEGHQSLLKPAVAPTPAAPTPPVPGAPSPARPSTPSPTDGIPANTREYWLGMMQTDKEQFRRRGAEYLRDKRAGGW